MWRNQYYPTATADAPQDTQWNVQKTRRAVALRRCEREQSAAQDVAAVWSPPADYKCVVATNGLPDWGTCYTAVDTTD